jgi:hypothetical protein
MLIKTCVICEEEFDLHSPAKQKKGGLANTCIDCSEETTVKYAGVQAADGKQSQATILKFKSDEDKEKYLRFWKNNNGTNVGKKCQLGSHLSTTPDISFETVVSFTPTNHKGKA